MNSSNANLTHLAVFTVLALGFTACRRNDFPQEFVNGSGPGTKHCRQGAVPWVG